MGLLCYTYEPVWIDNVKLLHEESPFKMQWKKGQ